MAESKVSESVGSLRPDERVQKILLSTPSRFVGEFEGSGLLIAYAWPPFHTGKLNWHTEREDSLRRTAIVLSFRTPAPDSPAPGLIIPNYEHVGELAASALSVLFGKLFDSHGPLEMSGFFGVPDLSAFGTPRNPDLHFHNTKPRADFGVPLEFSEIRRIAPLFEASPEDRECTAFFAAAKFYRRSLLAMETDPESSYLNLITAGEIISNFHDIPDTHLLDSETTAALERIRTELPGGDVLARKLKSQLRGVKRRFVRALVDMTDDSFFDQSEVDDIWGRFRKADFEKRISAAYDLRSRYVHTGISFGNWIKISQRSPDIQSGKPILKDKGTAAILEMAPLLSGLERVVRHVLLQFSKRCGADLAIAAVEQANGG